MRYVHLALALVWFVVGLVMLVVPLVNPAVRGWTIVNTNISAGWFALFLAGYFLLRSWVGQLRHQPPPERHALARRRHRAGDDAPIPEFMFDSPNHANRPAPGDDPGANGHADKTQ